MVSISLKKTTNQLALASPTQTHTNALLCVYICWHFMFRPISNIHTPWLFMFECCCPYLSDVPSIWFDVCVLWFINKFGSVDIVWTLKIIAFPGIIQWNSKFKFPRVKLAPFPFASFGLTIAIVRFNSHQIFKSEPENPISMPNQLGPALSVPTTLFCVGYFDYIGIRGKLLF